MSKLQKLVFFITNPGAVLGLLTWPRFSMTSYRMLSALKKQKLEFKTVLDVGANVGQFTVASLKLFPGVTIHAFEPQPDCMTSLKKSIKDEGNVTTYNVALGEYEGTADFHVNSHNHSSSILKLADSHLQAFPEAKESESISVRVTMLDSLLKEKAWPRPCLMKLDVQGYERCVLQGGVETLKDVDFVIIETSFKPLYEGEALFLEMVEIMRSHGFEFVRPVGWLMHPETEEMLQMDALFSKLVST